MTRVPAEIVVTNRVRIPGSEIDLSYARSGGPGGQHVNRTETKVLLRWRPRASAALSPADLELLERRLGARLTKEGDLLVTSQVHREQSRNVEDALERLRALVRRAIRRPRARKATRPTAASRVRRRESKRRRGETKRLRRGPTE